MSHPTTTIFKFIGTISLGLLTGVTYTTTSTLLPPLQALPSAQPASHTFTQQRALVQKHQLLLSTLSSASLVLAYAFAPPRGRHPYLLWAALAVEAGYVKEIFAALVGGGKRKGGEGRGGGRARTPDSSGSDEEWEVEGGGSGGLNGEAVREGMERWRGKMVVRTVVWGVGWLVTVVGMWGDGI